jgi:hypothetical protein
LNFGTGNGPANGSLSPVGWKAGTNSRLTVYWPNIFYQDDSATLQQIYFNPGNPANDYWGQASQFGPAEGSSGPVHLSSPSGLVALPLDQSYNGLSVFYDRDDGKLQQYNWSSLVSTGSSKEGWNVGK